MSSSMKQERRPSFNIEPSSQSNSRVKYSTTPSRTKQRPSEEPQPEPARNLQIQEPVREAPRQIHPFAELEPVPQIQTFNFILPMRFQLAATVTRTRFCILVLLLAIRIFAILTAAVFWLSTPICFQKLAKWKAPERIFYELSLKFFSASPPTASIWRHVFPGTDYSNGPHLKLEVHSSSNPRLPVIYSASIPLLLDNPVIWLFLMALMFTCHQLLCFTHSCLNRARLEIRQANQRLN